MSSDEKEEDDNQQLLVTKTRLVFAELNDVMPSIGFLSRDKRLQAFITVTDHAQKFVDQQEFSEAELLFVLSMMMRKKKKFQKSAMMTAMTLPKLKKDILSPIGFFFANEVRGNMRLPPVENKSTLLP